MAKIWDHYEYRIGDYFLPYLINGDASGISNTERRELDQFATSVENRAIKDGFTVGHWDCSSEEDQDFGECEATDHRRLRRFLSHHRRRSRGAYQSGALISRRTIRRNQRLTP